jgi:lipid-A-disaccharide synthase
MPANSLCIVAGEPSGDLHGSLLAAEIKKQRPDWHLWGVGSERMAAAGCELWQDTRDWGVMGFADVLRSARLFRQRLRALADEVAQRRPSGVILIDYPGFNLRLASRVKNTGVGVYYYIVPQIWAWGRRRIRVFQRHVDRAIVVFPFEKTYFEKRGVAVEWVGHPFVDSVKASTTREELREQFGVGRDERLITLLPGARRQDFRVHMPIFLAAIARLKQEIPNVRIALGLAAAMTAEADTIRTESPDLLISSRVYDLVTASDLVITKTGTTTVECALLGTPMVTGYRMGILNYAIARSLVRVPFIAMPNLIAGRQAVPELVQSNLTPERVAQESYRLLIDSEARGQQIKALDSVRDSLGEPGAPARAATLICDWTESRQS